LLTRSRDGCSASLASLTRETGPKVVKGDPARRGEAPATGAPPTPQAHHQHHHPAAPTIAVSDSSLKFTHVLYNLSPAGTRRVRMHGQLLLLNLLVVLDCLSIINWNPKKNRAVRAGHQVREGVVHHVHRRAGDAVRRQDRAVAQGQARRQGRGRRAGPVVGQVSALLCSAPPHTTTPFLLVAGC
jgi:hypothetical protein